MERITILSSHPREGNDLYSAANVTKRKAKVFGMFHGKEYDIRLRFTNRFAGVIIDEFGKDVMLIPKDNDHFEVTVRVEISPPFFAWVSTFGSEAQIISPEPVVEEMRQFINNISKLYDKKGEK